MLRKVPVTRRRVRNVALWTGVVLLVAAIAAELVARFYFGLGDPPLFVADPEIEYLYKPSSEYRRFGNRIAFNSYSMRSDEFPPKQASPHEFRVLVMGDSIINGGAQTDQSQLATTILQRHLGAELNRPVFVGNVSAGSWGPSNLLAYARRYGFFDADALVVVISSHDYADAPTFLPMVGVNPTMPERSPLLALADGFGRYALPRLKRLVAVGDPVPSAATPGDVSTALNDLTRLLELARGAVPTVIVFHHRERAELDGVPRPGFAELESTVKSAGLELQGWGDAMAEEVKAGRNPFRDGMHPNDLGQRLIAMRMKRELLKSAATRGAP